MRRHRAMLRAGIGATFFFVLIFGATRPSSADPTMEPPPHVDVRGLQGVPKGTDLRSPTPQQLQLLEELSTAVGTPVEVQYNGLTATPRHLFNPAGYLTPPAAGSAEAIARGFLERWKGIFRFDEDDLGNLRLKSKATLADTGTTILLFEQNVGGLPIYKGEVLVNVSGAGQILSVGGDSFPQPRITNDRRLTASEAVEAAAAGLRVDGFQARSIGRAKVLKTFGELPHEFVDAPRFDGAGVFSDEIVVTSIAFPLGDTARRAYRMQLSTPQYDGVTWLNIVDAETGRILRRVSMTASQTGGGQGIGRRPTLRPDIQNRLESMNPAGTASGKVFDSNPTALSGRLGFGRSTMRGDPPNYASETATVRNSGRGFKQSQVFGRNQNGLVYDVPFGQVLRGLPDAANPSAESPFGWFYLPSGSSGAEIAVADTNRAGTRDFGYTMHAQAQNRNVAANSPVPDRSQPFAATLTPLTTPRNLADGRVLTSVYESMYTEGNNVFAADDHQRDDNTTHGIKGYAPDRRFIAPHFDFINSYEYGSANAATGNIPSTAFPDTYPAAVTLFYFTNIVHDYLFGLGFTESLWNFQQDNFGKGGAGSDAISAEVQDGSGTNNANFFTPNDGERPAMQMFLFTEAGNRRADGDFDFDIVAHELFHGVSNRSVGKGTSDCLGNPVVGESGGQGEGWSDYIAASMADDDGAGEYATGEFDIAIRRFPVTNYIYSYGALNGGVLPTRDRGTVVSLIPIPFETHNVGEVFSAMLWDMRELLIMKDPSAVFFDGTRRLGAGRQFYAGYNRLTSVDSIHPIDFRRSFGTSTAGTVEPRIDANHIVRPGLVASEITSLGHRNGPLSTAVSTGARLSDALVLRGMQLSPCTPSIVDTRDSILLGDQDLTDGENRSLIWRAFASHGVGVGARSSSKGTGAGLFGVGAGTDPAPAVVEDFAVPAGVTECEEKGPLPPPPYALSNITDNKVSITINGGVPVFGASRYLIRRSVSPSGPFIRIGDIPATQTFFEDNGGGEGLVVGDTYYYEVRATRNPECVSAADVKNITITLGVPGIGVGSAPIFAGLTQVSDPGQCDRLILSWQPATSLRSNADIVYDIFRVERAASPGNPPAGPGNGTVEPTFTPSDANRIATGIRGLSYVDTGRTLNQIYYYIVQARDLGNGKKDTNNLGNRVTRYGATDAPGVTDSPTFAFESFESSSANGRFTPGLIESGNDPDESVAAFQRVTGVNMGGGVTSTVMYAPDFDPLADGGGAQSDFSARIGPFTFTPTSTMEFDHFFNTEEAFDGGVIEISSSPSFNNSTPYPDNSTTFDLGDFMVEGAYNGKFDGTFEGVMTSALLERRAYTGQQGLEHVRISLSNFAPGGRNNSSGSPMYIRFRMTSDFGTAPSPDGGWYIDNLVINSLDAASCTAAAPGPGPGPIPEPRQIVIPEGTTQQGFSTFLLLANPSESEEAEVDVTFLTGSGPVSPAGTQNLTIQPGQRRTVSVNEALGEARQEVATKVEFLGAVVAEVSVHHAGGLASMNVGGGSPDDAWVLAEGATHSGFTSFVSIANPDLSRDTHVKVDFLTKGSGPVPGPQALRIPSGGRVTLDVAKECNCSDDVSTKIEAAEGEPPVAAGLSMLKTSGADFAMGGSLGLTETRTVWSVAEGATHSDWHTFVLVANPSEVPAAVDVTFLTKSQGAVAGPQSLAVPPLGRVTIDVNRELGFADDVSTLIEASAGVVVEGTIQKQDTSGFVIADSIASGGSSPAGTGGTFWTTAEGATHSGFVTFILIANPDAGVDATVNVSFLTRSAGVITPADLQGEVVAKGSRITIAVNRYVSSDDVATLVQATSGKVLVEMSIDGQAGGGFSKGRSLATRLIA